MTYQSTLFLIILIVTFAAVANLARLLWDISIVVGPLTLPGWTGGIAYLALGLLASWAFRALFSLSDLHPTDPSDL